MKILPAAPCCFVGGSGIFGLTKNKRGFKKTFKSTFQIIVPSIVLRAYVSYFYLCSLGGIILILQEKLRLREIPAFSQGHTTSRWQSWGLTPALSDSNAKISVSHQQNIIVLSAMQAGPQTVSHYPGCSHLVQATTLSCQH